MVYTENEDGDEDGCVILYSTGTVVIQRGTGDGGSRRTFREDRRQAPPVNANVLGAPLN